MCMSLTILVQQAGRPNVDTKSRRFGTHNVVRAGEGNERPVMIGPEQTSKALMLDWASNILQPGQLVIHLFTGHF